MTNQNYALAAADFGQLLTQNPWLGPTIQVGGPELSRLECVLRRRWRGMAAGLSDTTLRDAALDLVENRCQPIQGSDYRTWLGIDRPLLRELSAAARSSDQELIQLWLATMIWGYSTDNRGPSRVAKSMSIPATDFIDRLRLSLDRIDKNLIVDAYRGSQAKGRSYLPGIADSFFTKWFWTASIGNSALPLRLLIFDERVARSGRARGGAWTVQGKNTAQRYLYYCELVDAVATAHRLDPEQVEYALYCLG